MYKIDKIRSNFPMLNKNIIYLDNAATTYKPYCVINKEINIYKYEYALYKKGLYKTSINITEKIEKIRKFIAKFINANNNEIIFTKGSTESINLIANSFNNNFLTKGDNIILSPIEHHSNIIPWKNLSKKMGIEIRILKINNNGKLKINSLNKIIDNKTKLFTLSHISNVLGILNPINNIVSKIKEINKNTLVLIDGSQSIMRTKIDVKKINCDFFIFSGHKMYGPLGIGILYGKNKLLKKMNPWQLGGSMVKYVNLYKKKIIYMDSPWKFEAGSINTSAIIGFKSAISYINKIGINNIYFWEKKITEISIKMLKKIKNIIIYGSLNKIGIISFNIKNINNNDIGIMLNKENICIRTGNHCAIPLMNFYKVNGMCRISFAMYTNYNDILYFIDKLKYIINLF